MRTGVLFTDQSRKQLYVLFTDVQVETTVVQIHLRAATQSRVCTQLYRCIQSDKYV